MDSPFILDPINTLWEKNYSLMDTQIHGEYNEASDASTFKSYDG